MPSNDSLAGLYLNISVPRGGVQLRPNDNIASALADALVDALPDSAQRRYDGMCGINPEHVPHIANLLQEIVAYTVASLIDAGSERDAVMENEVLATVLENELAGWVIP